ncbi:MAG: phosphate acetyltransferase [Planctomycetota bacterium]|nr:MAG: phosphate acetyltransferase [Planctomycetota bacterium]
MSQTMMIVPTHSGVGTTSVCLGLLRACERANLTATFCKPIAQPGSSGDERSTSLVRRATSLNPPRPIPFSEAERLLSRGDEQVLMERVVELAGSIGTSSDVLIVEGLVPSNDFVYADKINESMAKALDAQVILVTAPIAKSVNVQAVIDHLTITARGYGEGSSRRLLGCIVNQWPVSVDAQIQTADPVLGEIPLVDSSLIEQAAAPIRNGLKKEGLSLIGLIPAYGQLSWLRSLDVARQLGARIHTLGDAEQRRIKDMRIIARTVANSIEAFDNGTLIITPGDREDILLAVTVATLGGTRFAGLLLTGGFDPNPKVMELCQPAFDSGLPVFFVDSNSFTSANRVMNLDLELPVDDDQRTELVMNTVAGHIDPEALTSLSCRRSERRLSPPAFRHLLIERARAAKRCIVLPEGDEPRTLRAAAICVERGIARCLLIGKPESIHEEAQRNGIHLPEGIGIIDPSLAIDRYVEPLVELRRHKGMTPAIARDELADHVMLGTMMLKLGEVDGLVSGAVHTTANTIRPALQLIKTAPGSSLVSSVFFMCLPDQVVVYGDCAVNPEPSAEQLADIALQSAASAEAFGIPARVAMISYSTGASGSGAEVERVREATRLARERRPDLLIDGPLQYDAASIESVARSKAPDSPVAGRATVFIFPDLNTGNTTYKAVQRSASVVSIGPLLQGLAKPVNDLSRGALVEDIVYTIALTAIQAQQLAP